MNLGIVKKIVIISSLLLLTACISTEMTNREWDKREWTSTTIEDFDPASGSVASKLPENAFARSVNLITDDGLIASSPYQEV